MLHSLCNSRKLLNKSGINLLFIFISTRFSTIMGKTYLGR